MCFWIRGATVHKAVVNRSLNHAICGSEGSYFYIDGEDEEPLMLTISTVLWKEVTCPQCLRIGGKKCV